MSSGKVFIKRGPLKTFLFFLGFSAIIWVFVQFSKEYTEVVELPVAYINVPKDKILRGNNPKVLDLRLHDNGFNLAMHKFLPSKLKIDVSEATEKNGQMVYNLELQKEALLSQLKVDYENATFLQKTVTINFEQRAVKTLAVISNMELSFAVGYSAQNEIKFEPDSVRVSGPKNILDTLKVITTEGLKIKNISNNLKGKVKLDTSHLNGINLYQDEVSYSLKTDKFTEGQVKISIEPVNIPNNGTVVIFPKEVIVFYQVSLQKFSMVKPMDFRVVVDLKNAVDGDGYLVAQIIEKPDIVTNVRLNEKRIQFVLKR